MGAGLEAMVEQLMSLGFPRDQVQLALRAAYNNAGSQAHGVHAQFTRSSRTVQLAAGGSFSSFADSILCFMLRSCVCACVCTCAVLLDRAAEYLFDPAQLHAAMRQQGQGRASAPQSGVAAPAGGQSPAGGQPPAGGAPSSDAQAHALAQLMANAQQGAGGAAGAEAGAVAGGDAGGAVDAANPLAGLAQSPQFQQASFTFFSTPSVSILDGLHCWVASADCV